MAVTRPRALGGRRYACDHGAMQLAVPENWSDGEYSHRLRSLGKTSASEPRAWSAPEASSHFTGRQLVFRRESNGIRSWYTALLSMQPRASTLPTYTSTSPPPGASEAIIVSPHETGVA